MQGIYLKKPLNILSCAVAGRPGRSAYETAVAAGYTGDADEYAALLASIPGALSRRNTYNGRVDIANFKVTNVIPLDDNTSLGYTLVPTLQKRSRDDRISP